MSENIPVFDPEDWEEANYPQHNDAGFCWEGPCPCHEDQDNMNKLNQAVQDGLASIDDANRIYRGHTIY